MEERRSQNDEIVGNQIRKDENWAASDKSEPTGGNRKKYFTFFSQTSSCILCVTASPGV
jgi:hypothetical protein